MNQLDAIMEGTKIVFLFISINFTIVNLGRTYAKQDVSAQNVLIHAFGLTGFIYLQWIMK